MPGAATILHADLDAFFASVEQRDRPELRGKPVVVGGGVCLACSYEAKARGVKSAMGASRWKPLCPEAVVVEPRFSAYVEASRAVFEVFRDTAPFVEALSIDEAFLDVRGMDRIAGPPPQIAAELRRRVRQEVGLPITVGVASTKALAKVASAHGKPDGLLVVPEGGELDFLHPLPVEALWGVGPATARRLHGAGIRSVAQLAAAGEDALVELVGRAHGRHLHALSLARDPRPVKARPGRRSYGAQSAIRARADERERVEQRIAALVDRVTRRMRAKGATGRTVTLRLRFPDFTERATRSTTLADATAESGVLLDAARGLLDIAWPLIGERGGLTLVGVTVSGVERDPGQLALALDGSIDGFAPTDRTAGGRRDTRALDAALDTVRDRFGPSAVTRAALVGHREAQPWLSPDEEPDLDPGG